eukprot:jgi/Bigna1/70287/fgenesh1_pg.11_\
MGNHWRCIIAFICLIAIPREVNGEYFKWEKNLTTIVAPSSGIKYLGGAPGDRVLIKEDTMNIIIGGGASPEDVELTCPPKLSCPVGAVCTEVWNLKGNLWASKAAMKVGVTLDNVYLRFYNSHESSSCGEIFLTSSITGGYSELIVKNSIINIDQALSGIFTAAGDSMRVTIQNVTISGNMNPSETFFSANLFEALTANFELIVMDSLFSNLTNVTGVYPKYPQYENTSALFNVDANTTVSIKFSNFNDIRGSTSALLFRSVIQDGSSGTGSFIFHQIAITNSSFVDASHTRGQECSGLFTDERGILFIIEHKEYVKNLKVEDCEFEVLVLNQRNGASGGAFQNYTYALENSNISNMTMTDNGTLSQDSLFYFGSGTSLAIPTSIIFRSVSMNAVEHAWVLIEASVLMKNGANLTFTDVTMADSSIGKESGATNALISIAYGSDYNGRDQISINTFNVTVQNCLLINVQSHKMGIMNFDGYNNINLLIQNSTFKNLTKSLWNDYASLVTLDAPTSSSAVSSVIIENVIMENAEYPLANCANGNPSFQLRDSVFRVMGVHGFNSRALFATSSETSNMFFLNVTRCTFKKINVNEANQPAIVRGSGDSQAIVNIINSTFEDCLGNGDGGMFSLGNNGFLNVRGSTFTRITNKMGGSKGGIVYITSGITTFSNCNINECSGSKDGGAFYQQEGDLVIDSCRFNRTSVDTTGSGGVLNQAAGIATVGSTVVDTSRDIFYGGFAYISGTITMSDSTLTNLMATEAAFLYINNGATASLERVSVSHVNASMSAFFYVSGRAVLKASRFTGTDGYGSQAVHADTTNVVMLSDSTFSNFFGRSEGGLVYAGARTRVWLQRCTIRNIVGRKFGGIVSVGDFANVVISGGFISNVNVEGNGGVVYVVGEVATINITGVSVDHIEALNGGLVWIWNGAQAHISHSNITHCKSNQGGGVVYAMSNAGVSISDLRVTKSSADSGGVVSAHGNAQITVIRSYFSGINATNGALIYATGGAMVGVSDVIADSLSGSYGAAIYLRGWTEMYLTNVHFSNVQSRNSIVEAYDYAYLEITDSTFTRSIPEDPSLDKAAVFDFSDSSEIQMQTVTLFNNTVGSSGSVVYWQSTSSVTAGNCSFQLNSGATAGSGIYLTKGTLFLNRSTFEGNTATRGAALSMIGGSAFIVGCTFDQQRASGGSGGAISVLSDKGVYLNLNGSTFTRNNATGNGGAISFKGGAVSIVNCTFSANSAGQHAGALEVTGTPSFLIISSRFCANTAGIQASVRRSVYYYERPRGGAVGIFDVPFAPDYSIRQTVFEENAAPNGSGGAIFHERARGQPVYHELTFTNNQAVQGSDTASNAESLQWNASGLNIPSGKTIPAAIFIVLKDVYGNLNQLHDITTAELLMSNSTITKWGFDLSGGEACVGGGCPVPTDTIITGKPDSATKGRLHVTVAKTGGFTTYDLYSTEEVFYILPCQAGQSRQESTCGDCTVGTYMPTAPERVMECFDCPAGTYAATSVSTSCTQCAPGKVSTVAQSSSCVPCLENYIPDDARSACVACPANGESDTNRTSCYCLKGFYSLEAGSATTCNDCPTGGVCDSPNTTIDTILPALGYWRDIYVEATAEYIQCPVAYICKDDGSCYSGSEGIACTVCKSGYGRLNDYECERCPPLLLNILRIFGAYFLVMAAGILLTYINVNTASRSIVENDTSRGAKNRKDNGRSSIILKILLNTIQFNAIALSFEYRWPAAVHNLLRVQSYGGNAMASLMNVDCALQGVHSKIRPFYINSLIIAIFPILIPALAYVAVMFTRACRQKGGGEAGHQQGEGEAYDQKERSGETQLQYDSDEDEDSAAHLYTAELTTAMVSLFFSLYPSLVLQTFKLFQCKQLGSTADTFVLQPDMSERCHQGAQLFWMLVLGLPMAAIYVLGFPIVCFILLYKDRDHLPSRWPAGHGMNVYQQEMSRIASMKLYLFFHGFKPEFYFYEVVIMVRKLLVVAIAVFAQHQMIQALLGSLLVVIFLTLQVSLRPFQESLTNGIEFYSLIVSFITFFLGLFLFSPIGVVGEIIVSFVIVTANIIFYAVAGYYLMHDLYYENLAEKGSKPVNSENELTRHGDLRIDPYGGQHMSKSTSATIDRNGETSRGLGDVELRPLSRRARLSATETRTYEGEDNLLAAVEDHLSLYANPSITRSVKKIPKMDNLRLEEDSKSGRGRSNQTENILFGTVIKQPVRRERTLKASFTSAKENDKTEIQPATVTIRRPRRNRIVRARIIDHSDSD